MSNAQDDFSRLELNLAACDYNYRYFRSRLKRATKLLVLVKANAYGHGAVEFALMMQNAGLTIWQSPCLWRNGTPAGRYRYADPGPHGRDGFL